MAGGGPVSALTEALETYLKLRRSLGHDLADAARLLPRFVDYLDSNGIEFVTIEAAVAWSQAIQAEAGTTVWPHRMIAVRGFARFLSGADPRTQIPPIGLMPMRRHWRPPFIYSDADVSALMAQCRRQMASAFRAATYETMIGLLTATGLRVGEALRLDRGDVDWPEGVLQIRRSKFGKSRQVPLHPTVVEALAEYARKRDEFMPRPLSPSFFIANRGTRLIYPTVSQEFVRLRGAAGVGSCSPIVPRIHGLRHTFAVRTLVDWYRDGVDVHTRVPWLSTYLGHRDPRYTYWYLSAAPELLAHAAARLERAQAVEP